MSSPPRITPVAVIPLAVALSLGGALHGRTITVTTGTDEIDTPSGPRISLREAVRDLGAGGGTICLDPGVLEITLDRTLAMTSAGGLTVIDAAGFGGHPVRIGASEVFGDASLISVENRRVEIRNAVFRRVGGGAGGFLDQALDVRGGSELRVERCEFTQWQSASLSATAVRCLAGSALRVLDCEFRGNLTGIRAVAAPQNLAVENSLFCFNREGAVRAVIDAETTLLLRNSTFAENIALDGAVSLAGSAGEGMAAINHCSFVDNASPGVRVPAAVGVDYCLFARNVPYGSAGASVSVLESGSYGATSGGHNLADDSPASLAEPTDMTGTAVKVSRLGDFGGAHYCCFPLVGSRAIDGGDANRQTVLPATDVRGFARKARAFGTGTFTNIVDIGAVETNPEGTLEVTQTGNFGTGSLREAVAMTTGETAHIVLRTAITSRVLAVNTPILFDENRNYVIDATQKSYQFAAADDGGPMFEIRGNSAGGVRPAVAFLGCNVDGFEADTSSPRGCIRVVSGDLALHRSHLTNNICNEAGLIEVDRGGLFLNECSFVDNVQSAGGTVDNYGGVALHVKSTPTTCWNSSFIRNRTEPRSGGVSFDGGAVRIEIPSRAIFRQCTLVRNEAAGPGAAIFFGDYSGTGETGLILDRCTIVGNRNTSGVNAAKGAVTFADRATVEVRASLFAHNSNRGSLVATNDLHALQGAGKVAVAAPCPNWTTWPEAFPGLVEAENLSAELKFVPPANWGDLIPTMPLRADSALVMECARPDSQYPRDAVNDAGMAGPERRATPGAVQKTVAFDEALAVTLVNMSGGTATVRVRGRTGITWQVETATTLETFMPTGQTYTGSILSTTLNIPIPAPRPRSWFYRLRESTE